MNWTTVAQSIVVAVGKAIVQAFARSRSEKPNTSEPGDATAERQGTAAGAAANYSSKATERHAHTSLEAKLDAKLSRKS